MNKLSIKIFFILLPLAISILSFGYAYYQARERLTVDHIIQSGQLSTSLGASELSHYIDGRFIEFDRLSTAMAGCEVDDITLSETASNAINFTRGFSALMITGVSGRVTTFNLSANKSNRYILRKNIDGQQILSNSVLAQLEGSYRDWLASYNENKLLEQQTLNKLLELKKRGEENSYASRRASNQLVELREKRNLPKLVLTLASKQIISDLGLIFDNESYFYSRPLVDCEQNLLGYYTAVLDRTLIEDQLFNIKTSLIESGLEHVDVMLIRNRDLYPLSEAKYLSIEKLHNQGLNTSEKPEVRDDLNGILINRPIRLNLKTHLIYEQELPKQASDPKFGVTLAVFVSEDDLTKSNAYLLREVAFYLAIALLLFAALTLYLSHYIASPIVDLRKRIALLSREGKTPTDFKLRDDEIGDLFTAFSAMAHSIKYKESQLTKLAHEDPLTGILNRRALVDNAENIRRIQAPSTICMMDLDHFKQVNDICGHAVGDKVLKSFCQIVSNEIRQSDIFGRMGGEEFALILPRTNLEEAEHLAERIRQKIEQELADNVCKKFKMPITVSIGIVEWEMEDFNKALSRADKHLYQAKAGGRNQTVVETKKGS